MAKLTQVCLLTLVTYIFKEKVDLECFQILVSFKIESNTHEMLPILRIDNIWFKSYYTLKSKVDKKSPMFTAYWKFSVYWFVLHEKLQTVSLFTRIYKYFTEHGNIEKNFKTGVQRIENIKLVEGSFKTH